MSTYNSIRKIEREISRLNEQIDLRIVRGLSYKTLSRQHKLLVTELRDLRREAGSEISWSKNFMMKFTQYASVFLM